MMPWSRRSRSMACLGVWAICCAQGPQAASSTRLPSMRWSRVSGLRAPVGADSDMATDLPAPGFERGGGGAVCGSCVVLRSSGVVCPAVGKYGGVLGAEGDGGGFAVLVDADGDR